MISWYNNCNLLFQVKNIESRKADQLAKLNAEIKDKDELNQKKKELDEKCEREINNQSNKVSFVFLSH